MNSLQQSSLQAAAQEMMRRRTIRTSFTKYCEAALEPQGFSPAPHHRFLIDYLEKVERGDIERLMIFMPPGSAKSTYASHLFPTWYMSRNPGHIIMAASHTATLAQDFSGKVQSNVREMPLELDYGLATEAKDRWYTTNGCTYKASGAGQPIAGFRADLFIIDDPFGSRADADSATTRDNIWKWYVGDIHPRLKPGGKIILIQTRWHEDDLAGRLQSQQGAEWTIVKLPAIAGINDQMGRQPGEWLWDGDANYGYAKVAQNYRRINGEGRDWWSLYQQEPRPSGGGLFKVGQIGILEDPLLEGKTVRAWDFAATKQVGTNNPDWTVGLKLTRTLANRFVVSDVVRFRAGPEEVEARLLTTAREDGPSVQISIPQDPGQAGKSQVLHLTRMLMGFNVHSSPESGEKSTRAAAIAAQCNVGNLSIIKGQWNRDFIDELTLFPSGSKDDQVDALSRASSLLITPAYDSSMKWVG